MPQKYLYMDNIREHIFTEEEIKEDLRYLQLLAQSYPNVAEASCEIINLEAILNLPKPIRTHITSIRKARALHPHLLPRS